MLRSLVLCLALCARALGFCVGSGPPRLHVPKRHRLAAQAMLPPDAPPVQRWFDGVEDEAAIKRRFKELAVKLHPDANLDDAEAEGRFKDLSRDYTAALKRCKSEAELAELQSSWVRLGGMAAAVALVLSNPAITVAAAATLASQYLGLWTSGDEAGSADEAPAGLLAASKAAALEGEPNMEVVSELRDAEVDLRRGDRAETSAKAVAVVTVAV